MFERGRSYTREQIREAVGGDAQSWLPAVDGRVVAGLFRRVDQPEAPVFLLGAAGDPVDRHAEALAAQGPIPVFEDDGAGLWRYLGEYRCAAASRERDVVEAHAAAVGRSDVVCVLHFEHEGLLTVTLGRLDAAGRLLFAGSLAVLALVAIPLGRWALEELPPGYLRNNKSWLGPLLAVPCVAAAALFYWAGARVLRRFGVRTTRI